MESRRTLFNHGRARNGMRTNLMIECRYSMIRNCYPCDIFEMEREAFGFDRYCAPGSQALLKTKVLLQNCEVIFVG